MTLPGWLGIFIPDPGQLALRLARRRILIRKALSIGLG
jgi:hypothetical protein